MGNMRTKVSKSKYYYQKSLLELVSFYAIRVRDEKGEPGASQPKIPPNISRGIMRSGVSTERHWQGEPGHSRIPGRTARKARRSPPPAMRWLMGMSAASRPTLSRRPALENSSSGRLVYGFAHHRHGRLLPRGLHTAASPLLLSEHPLNAHLHPIGRIGG